MPAPVATYLILAAGFSVGWVIRTVAMRRQVVAIPVRVEDERAARRP